MTEFLDKDTFFEVVKNTPLVSIDLIVRNIKGEVLVGLRNNEPAKGFWFVPGGRICKNEKISEAFDRISRDELGQSIPMNTAKQIGVFEHIHDTNFAEIPGIKTHYIVLAYLIDLNEPLPPLPPDQHSQYKWIRSGIASNDNTVHKDTQAYFNFI